MSIPLFFDKIKTFFIQGWGREILVFLLFSMALLASFYLGKSSTIALSGSPVLVEVQGVPTPAVQQKSNVSSSGGGEGSFVAAKTGSRYYPADCGSASRIKPENKVYFKTESAAEAAGYTKAQTCK